MGNEYRVESTVRPSIYQPSAEPAVRQSLQGNVAATGLEKSTALASLDQVRGSAGIAKGRGAEFAPSASDFADQQKTPALTFSDLIDVINPLQHIPLVSNVYRNLTGDEISGAAQVAGDALYFGPIAAVASVANLAIKEASGFNIGDEVASFLTGDEAGDKTEEGPVGSESPAPVQTASLLSATGQFTEQSAESDRAPGPAADLPAEAEAPAIGDVALAPDQPFSFDAPVAAAVPETPRAASFASTPEPVALESLPSDILAALYSGQPVRANQGHGETASAAPPPPEAPAPAAATGYSSPAEAAPRWNLWSSPDEALAAPAVVRAYGGIMPNDVAQQGSVASQGGWFGANMPEVLARYQDSASLQRMAAKPFVDVSQ